MRRGSTRIAPGDREIGAGRGKLWTRALEAWDDRLDMAAARRAVEGFKEIAATDDRPEAWAWCARAHFFVGDYQPHANERSRWHVAGYRLGRRGIALDVSHVAACFWTAVCLGSYIEHVNLLKAALYVPETVRCLTRVYNADMEYYHGGLARYLGQALVRQPVLTQKFLAIAMPDVTADIVIAGLRKAIDEAPPIVLNVQTLGEVAFHVHKDRDTVREMLALLRVLDLDADANLAPENHLDLPRAQQRLSALL